MWSSLLDIELYLRSVEVLGLGLLFLLATLAFVAYRFTSSKNGDQETQQEQEPESNSCVSVAMGEERKVSRQKSSRTLKTQTRIKNKATSKSRKNSLLKSASVEAKLGSCPFENKKFVQDCKAKDDTLVDDIVSRLLAEQEKRDGGDVAASGRCPFGYDEAAFEQGEEVQRDEAAPVRDLEYVAPVDARDANDVAMYLLRKSKSLTDEDQLLSKSEKETEAELRQEQLKNIFKLLEENDEAFVKSQSGPMLPVYEDEEEYRFRVLEEDGSYSQMSLDNVFKTQIKLYGL